MAAREAGHPPVRVNFFRETATDQSIYDELLVVRPPKRIVGGLTLKF